MNIKKYFCSNWKIYILIVIILVVFLISFPLYQLPLNIIIYPAVVSIAFTFIYFIIDYNKVKKKYAILENCKNALDEITDYLPQAADEVELEYQKLIGNLRETLADREMMSNEKFTEMMDYFSVWVHQIKTPIASMRLLLEGQDSAEARKISSELNRIEQYVSMVLTYFRLDSESNDFVLREYSVDEIIRPSIKKFARDFIGKKLSLEYESIDKKIVTDKKWFSFVVEQILSNALKYTYEGGIKIYEENDMLVIEDSGIGIAPEDQPRIFEKGYTGYNGRVEEKSSGIGLYLCKRVCNNLRILLDIKSEVSMGTAVYIGLSQSDVNFRD